MFLVALALMAAPVAPMIWTRRAFVLLREAMLDPWPRRRRFGEGRRSHAEAEASHATGARRRSGERGRV